MLNEVHASAGQRNMRLRDLLARYDAMALPAVTTLPRRDTRQLVLVGAK
jgi:hypothetical protein